MDENQENKDSRKNRNWYFYGRVYPGIWLIIIGTIFLLNNFGILHGNVWGKIWPIFIIVPGVFMLLRPRH